MPLGYKSVQHVTVLNTVGNCSTVVNIIILHCKIIKPIPARLQICRAGYWTEYCRQLEHSCVYYNNIL